MKVLNLFFFFPWDSSLGFLSQGQLLSIHKPSTRTDFCINVCEEGIIFPFQSPRTDERPCHHRTILILGLLLILISLPLIRLSFVSTFSKYFFSDCFVLIKTCQAVALWVCYGTYCTTSSLKSASYLYAFIVIATSWWRCGNK